MVEPLDPRPPDTRPTVDAMAPSLVTAARSAAPWWVAGAAAAGCVALAVVDPTEHTVTPPCPFRVATTWWCPFCGGTRSVSRLVRGDLSAAFRFNALLVVSIPLVVAAWWVWAMPGRWQFADRAVQSAVTNRRFWAVVSAIVVAFVVVRNVAPFDAVLRFPGA